MKNTLKKLFEQVEKLDWTVTHETENVFMFSKFSPAGQDFNISVDTENNVDCFLNNIYSYYSDFDCSEETYLWLDSSGHGVNGAPYDMKDLYEDMEACQEMILELYNELRNWIRNENKTLD